MGLTFGTSVSINNLLALKSFNTFLFNYQLHDKPTWIDKLWIPRLKAWIEERAIIVLSDLLISEDAKKASVSLNDVSGDYFAVLAAVQNPQYLTEIKNGQELFILLAQMALEFEKIKKPRTELGYKSNEPRS